MWRSSLVSFTPSTSLSGGAGVPWAVCEVGDARGPSDAHAFQVLGLDVHEPVELVVELEGVEPHVEPVIPRREQHQLENEAAGERWGLVLLDQRHIRRGSVQDLRGADPLQPAPVRDLLQWESLAIGDADGPGALPDQMPDERGRALIVQRNQHALHSAVRSFERRVVVPHDQLEKSARLAHVDLDRVDRVLVRHKPHRRLQLRDVLPDEEGVEVAGREVVRDCVRALALHRNRHHVLRHIEDGAVREPDFDPREADGVHVPPVGEQLQRQHPAVKRLSMRGDARRGQRRGTAPSTRHGAAVEPDRAPARPP
eukprot:CAMPEP_0180383546 /NCGR_PEP_ID=MMETSP0989-20121125/28019_1 /TAXON_ID=697907 /ORGANISM="non described non described, Strain CCMP2293" /LENGTH=311 /DNA_ID=CAMNT_0022383861 /DNA_START=546 /DNA_END=1477 /DNA_ORIENTATION=+